MCPDIISACVPESTTAPEIARAETLQLFQPSFDLFILVILLLIAIVVGWLVQGATQN